MSAVALVLALLALPFALLDVRVAAGLVVATAVLAVVALTRGHWVWCGRAALVVALVAALLTGWEAWELRRPTPAAGPTVATSAQPGPDREVLLPLTVERAPITSLALLEFAGDGDPVYEGLEPQIVDRGHERGMRIIAYRHDGRTDFYDDLALTPDPDESSAVTGKGRLHYSHTDLGGPEFEVDDHGRLQLEFALTDVEGREITGVVRESTEDRSVPLGLLAPVGLSSTDPEYFPLFVLHRFEFVRTGGSEIDVRIDGAPVELAPFPAPVPVQGQLRNFAKYTPDAELHAVFPTDADGLRRVRTVGDLYRDGEATYRFDGDGLAQIVIDRTGIAFDPPLDPAAPAEGRITMTSHPEMGSVAGPYRVEVDGEVSRLRFEIDDVEVPRQRGLLYLLIVNERTAFGTWPTEYRYEATIDRGADTIDARWFNAEPGG